MNGLDSSVAPLVFGSLIPATILIIVSFVLEQISKRKLRQAMHFAGVTSKGVLRRSVIAGISIFLLMLFPLSFDIAIMFFAFVISLSTAAITFYTLNMPVASLLSVA